MSLITFTAETNTYLIEPGATTRDIEDSIRFAANGAVFQFTEGTFYLSETLNIERDNVTLTGAGQDKTVLVIDHNLDKEGIKINSGTVAGTAILAQDAIKGDTTITAAEGHGIQAGEYLILQQANDESLSSLGDYSNILDNPLSADRPLRESIARVNSVDENTIHLDHSLAYDLEGGITTIERRNFFENIELRDLTVTYDLGTPDPLLFENPLSDYRKNIAIMVNGTANLVVENVKTEDVASIGLLIRDAVDPYVNHFTADGAHNKGDNKNGYGLTIEEVFFGTFENLEFYGQRHSFLFSAWHAEAYNDVQINFTDRDINFHGSPDHSNTVLVSRAVYLDGSESWPLVEGPTSSHPYTNLDDNTVLFDYAEGSLDNEILYASDTGAYLHGKGGSDILIGSYQNDILIGGQGFDLLTGGSGRDVFRLQPGDNTITITDFETGAAGDILHLFNFGFYQDFSDLIFRQSGADTILYLYGPASVRFLNTAAGSLTADNVLIEQDSTAGATHLGDDTNEVITGSAYNDDLRGRGGNDTIMGLNGDDYIEGDDGDDIIDGGAGHDVLKGESGHDTINGGDGDDLIKGWSGNDTILGSAGSDEIYGGSGNDDIRGRDGADFIFGESGEDYFEGDEGNDRIYGGADNDFLRGEGGSDGLWGEDGNDLLKGFTGNDSLRGGNGNDTLYGGNDNDKLIGGLGYDEITGGPGSDRFAFEEWPDIADLVYDFNANGEIEAGTPDRIDIEDILDLFTGLTGAETATNFVDLGYLTFTETPEGTMMAMDRDGFVGTEYTATNALHLLGVAPADIDPETMIRI